jgi:hypothetical protein
VPRADTSWSRGDTGSVLREKPVSGYMQDALLTCCESQEIRQEPIGKQVKPRMKYRMAHPSFYPTFHPSFLSVSHAGNVSVKLSPELSLTILRHILAHSFHSPVKTALLFLTGQCAMRAACAEE